MTAVARPIACTLRPRNYAEFRTLLLTTSHGRLAEVQNVPWNPNPILKMAHLLADGAVGLEPMSQPTGSWVEQTMFSEARVGPTFSPESKG